jgi:hypothetical protein
MTKQESERLAFKTVEDWFEYQPYDNRVDYNSLRKLILKALFGLQCEMVSLKERYESESAVLIRTIKILQDDCIMAVEALDNIVETVDESLLLEEDLGSAWDTLHKGLQVARAALEKIKK